MFFMPRNPEAQRPRSYRRRRHQQSVSFDPTELALLKTEARLNGLALGALVRSYAVAGALQDRQRRREQFDDDG